MTRLLASLTSLRPLALGDDARRLIDAGVDALQVDIGDAHFVPFTTFGSALVAALADHLEAAIEVHLMVDEPEAWIREIAGSRVARIWFHIEATRHPVMPVVSALTWKNMMLNPVFGVVDYVMQLVHLPAVDWLAQFPLTAITGMVVWRWAPFMMLILLAGMQSLSEEIREAARVDGVSGIQEFRYIVLPHLNRFIQLGALLGSVYIVQEFDSIYMTTQGGPGTSSTNLPFLIYQVAFAKKDVGEASALGVIVVILTIIAVQYLLKVLTSLTEGD